MTTKARQDHNRKDKPTKAGNENTTHKQWDPIRLTVRALLWELVWPKARTNTERETTTDDMPVPEGGQDHKGKARPQQER